MAKKRLSEKEVELLLSQYRSERRRLNFQLEHVRSAMKDLRRVKAAIPKTPSGTGKSAPKAGSAKRGPGRPRKTEKVKGKAKRGPGRPPKRVVPPRELNPWDNMVLGTIKTSGKLMPKAELLKHAIKWAASHEAGMKRPDVEVHLTRTLQKLSGRKKLLGMHHTGLRRGNHYGLMEWFFRSSGKLRRQHLDRLVLTKEDR